MRRVAILRVLLIGGFPTYLAARAHSSKVRRSQNSSHLATTSETLDVHREQIRYRIQLSHSKL
ncbi:hypothetical protein SERLADRAFT_397739, partial [Serpula lacrymans var. lacrymans S7.9]